MNFAHVFTVLFLSLFYSKVYCRPQFQPTLDTYKRFTLSKKFDLNNKRSSIVAIIGCSIKSGPEFELNASHEFGKETKIKGFFKKLLCGGYQHQLELTKKLKNGMELKATYGGSNTGGNKIGLNLKIPIVKD